MAGTIALRCEIADILRGRTPEHPLIGDHLKAGLGQRRNLQRVVRDDAHLADAELPQHHGGEIEAPLIGLEAQSLVCIVGVVALRLKLVGADLVGDAVSPPLLVEIEQDAAFALRPSASPSGGAGRHNRI